MARMWKSIKTMFSYVVPQQEIPRLEPEMFREFPFLSEARKGERVLKDLDSDKDTPLPSICRVRLYLGFSPFGHVTNNCTISSVFLCFFKHKDA